MRRPLVALFVIFLAALAAPASLRAQDVFDANPALLLAKLAAADPDLQTYRADVAFNVGLRTFPYLRKTVHGNAYFKRPARLEVVFSDLPPIARAWSKLYVGLGTPTDWEKKFTITMATESATHEPYLLLTPRVADRRLRQVEVYVDRAVPFPERIVWRYRDGRIDMRQRFGRIEGHDLVVAQDADIRLPAVHAYVNVRITNYALNVEVADAIFTPKQREPEK